MVKKFNVSPNCFLPKPKVDSTVIQLQPKNEMIKIKNIENLEKITNIIFSNKRKMINKSIKKIFKRKEKLKKIKNLDLKKRPSDISPNVYYELTELYESF